MTDSSEYVDQLACTEVVVDETPGGAILANLGTATYILLAVNDRPRNYYMRGAMGVTTPTALGLALAIDENVTVLEGDGSMLMSMGALTTVARQDPANLVIAIMDNCEFATTGGLESLATETDFAAVAQDCGLEAWHVSSIDDFRRAYRSAVDHDGAALVSVDVSTTVPGEYPRLDYGHSYLKHRFRTAFEDE